MRFLTDCKADATADLVYRVRPGVPSTARSFHPQPRQREEEVDYALRELSPAVETLRSFSPVWREKIAAVARG